MASHDVLLPWGRTSSASGRTSEEKNQLQGGFTALKEETKSIRKGSARLGDIFAFDATREAACDRRAGCSCRRYVRPKSSELLPGPDFQQNPDPVQGHLKRGGK